MDKYACRECGSKAVHIRYEIGTGYTSVECNVCAASFWVAS